MPADKSWNTSKDQYTLIEQSDYLATETSMSIIMGNNRLDTRIK